MKVCSGCFWTQALRRTWSFASAPHYSCESSSEPLSVWTNVRRCYAFLKYPDTATNPSDTWTGHPRLNVFQTTVRGSYLQRSEPKNLWPLVAFQYCCKLARTGSKHSLARVISRRPPPRPRKTGCNCSTPRWIAALSTAWGAPVKSQLHAIDAVARQSHCLHSSMHVSPSCVPC